MRARSKVDGAAFVNALRFRGVDAGALPIVNEAKLHLGDRAEHSQDHATHRIRHWVAESYGVVTAKALAVLEALLWAFHNAKSGLCFPSYETIAAAAHRARSTVAEALRTLEEAGILSRVQRIKRAREQCPDLLGDNGWRWRILRTSNAHNFRDPGSLF
jgi:hypothetical protein